MPRPRPLASLTATAVVAGVVPVLLAAPANADEVYTVPSGGVFTVDGHGWGHGHGMSQWGAQGAATQGISATQIVSAYYPHTTAGTVANTPIRVQLTADEGKDLQVDPAPGLTATDASGQTTGVMPTGPKFVRWRIVAASSGGLVLQSSDGAAWTTHPIGKNAVSNGPVDFTTTAPTLRLRYPDRSARDYRGKLRAVQLGPGSMASVDVLPMESYLRGVVPRESPASWAPAALQAQAIAARSYAAYDEGQHRASWDICDSTSCQVFGGTQLINPDGSTAAEEAPSTDAAVQATAGQVRLYNGTPIFAEFSSSDGGWNADGGEPYLIARPDPWDGIVPNNVHSWTAQLPASAVEASYPAVGHLQRIVVVSRDGNGEWGGRIGAVRLEGVDSAGHATAVAATGQGIANAYPWPADSAGMKSNWWHIRVNPPSAPRGVHAVAGDGSATITWSAPADNGGSPVSSYRITATPAITPVTVDGSTLSATVTGLMPGTTYSFTVAASNAGGTGPGGTAPGVTTPAALGDVTPVPAARILDTRSQAHPLRPGENRAVQVTGVGGVPASGVLDVLVNVTTTQQTSAGYLTVWPAGGNRPTVSQLSWPAGKTTANLVLAKVGSNGRIGLHNSAGTTHVVVDVEGYVSSAAGGRLTAASPVRLLDTRRQLGASGPLSGRSSLALAVRGHGGVPANATAVVVKLTGVRPTKPTYLTAWPGGTARPTASVVNLVAGEIRTNEVVVPIGTDGAIDIGNDSGRTDVVADVEGWLAPAAGASPTGQVAGVQPARILDTRTPLGGHPAPVAGGHGVSLSVLGRGGVPSSGVAAVVLDVTVTGAAAGGYLTAYPSGTARPGSSALNFTTGVNTSAAVTVPVGADGRVVLWSSGGPVHVIADVAGWSSS